MTRSGYLKNTSRLIETSDEKLK